MSFFDWRSDRDASLGDIRTETPPGQLLPGRTQLSGPDFDREDRLHLQKRQPRHNDDRSRLFDQTLEVMRSDFLVVKLRESARVEEKLATMCPD